MIHVASIAEGQEIRGLVRILRLLGNRTCKKKSLLGECGSELETRICRVILRNDSEGTCNRGN